ncbi:MAG: universal stress protein [Cyclobacteriaceae bacterium]
MKKILVPTDFSKHGMAALETAVELAKKSGAAITLLHVVEQALTGSYTISGEGHPNESEERMFTYEMIKKSRQILEKQVMDPRFKNVTVTGELKLGNPYHGIRAIITDHKPDLVVMGARGNNSLERIILGSTTERVVRHMDCPVLTVHKKPLNFKFKNIVYATSMSEEEESFSQAVRRIQELFGATVHMVRINTPGDFQRDRSVKRYMQTFAKRIGLKNFTLNVYSDLTAEEGIIYFADEIKADMICMATHGRTGFAHVLAGSVAEDVVTHSRRPVLTHVI